MAVQVEPGWFDSGWVEPESVELGSLATDSPETDFAALRALPDSVMSDSVGSVAAPAPDHSAARHDAHSPPESLAGSPRIAEQEWAVTGLHRYSVPTENRLPERSSCTMKTRT